MQDIELKLNSLPLCLVVNEKTPAFQQGLIVHDALELGVWQALALTAPLCVRVVDAPTVKGGETTGAPQATQLNIPGITCSHRDQGGERKTPRHLLNKHTMHTHGPEAETTTILKPANGLFISDANGGLGVQFRLFQRFFVAKLRGAQPWGVLLAM